MVGDSTAPTKGLSVNVVRVRWAIRGVLTIGVAASTAANVLHAAQNPISQVIAAWPPLALLITIEVVARVPVHRRHLAVARRVAAVVIAGIAAWVSYWHMVGVAVRYGETGASAFLLPLSVDGLVLVASICLVELSIQRVDSPAPIPDRVDSAGGQMDSVAARVDRAPALQYARPIGPRPPRVDRLDRVDRTTRDAVAVNAQLSTTVSTRVGTGRLSNAARVLQAHAGQPDATDGQLAAQLDVSTKTIRRYRPRPTAGHANGHTITDRKANP